MVRGIKEAGLVFTREAQFLKDLDDAIDKDEQAYFKVANHASSFFKPTGIDVFVFTCDLEYALITEDSKTAVGKILSGIDKKKDYSKGYTLSELRRLIGSKTIPINANNDPPFKKPFIHKKARNRLNSGQRIATLADC